MNMSKILVSDELIARHGEKLKYWFNLLGNVMPDYFFQTFTPQQLDAIMPAMFNLQQNSGIQQITSEGSVILIYLKSDTNNMVTTARMMKHYNITGAVIHKSQQQIVLDGQPRTLVIEYYQTKEVEIKLAPLFTLSELKKVFRKRYKKVNPALEEFYSRINWNAVNDLTIDRLVERIQRALKVQQQDALDVDVEKAGKNEIRLTISMTNCPVSNFYNRIIECLALNGFDVHRLYLREVSFQDSPDNLLRMPVSMFTVYFSSDRNHSLTSKKMKRIIHDLQHLNWIDMDDLIYEELTEKKSWDFASSNFIRAAGEFIHSQFSYIDLNAYNKHDIFRLMVLYETLLQNIFGLFETRFNPDSVSSVKKVERIRKRIASSISQINTGMRDKDIQTKNIFEALLNFVMNICKTNYYVESKTALSFRMDPDFMKFYSDLSVEYQKTFGQKVPYGIFYFYRLNVIGYQIRFSDIARGGWRTVIPRNTGQELERMDAYQYANDEIFREVFVLAHTQHMKNKDIYEGGSKMICLLRQPDGSSISSLYEAQRSIARSFIDLINYDSNGKLKRNEVIDYLSKPEIIEIGPDENMFDVMIDWLSAYSESSGYTLGGGLISGKPETGINHKEFGVTSFGVHQYLLKTLEELGINPERDEFSVKISGGPFGDVAGNELQLLLQREKGRFVYPKVKIVAITDGPAAAYDPEGLDKEELLGLIKNKNLDSFSCNKLHGDNAYILFTEPISKRGLEKFRLVIRENGKIKEKLISRDEYMKIFQDNLMIHYADIFVPCGGRPSTISIANYQDYIANGIPSSKAIIEGANSFITPEARDILQENGVWIIKDASANKCGVITSSYEILSGLVFDNQEFMRAKKKLVKEIMEILKYRALREANWLYFHFKRSQRKLTDLTEELSIEINNKNDEISEWLERHPDIIKREIILKHLPSCFGKLDHKRLNRIPVEYKKAIVAVELACQIVYGRASNLEDEINSVLRNT